MILCRKEASTERTSLKDQINSLCCACIVLTINLVVTSGIGENELLKGYKVVNIQEVD